MPVPESVVSPLQIPARRRADRALGGGIRHPLHVAAAVELRQRRAPGAPRPVEGQRAAPARHRAAAVGGVAEQRHRRHAVDLSVELAHVGALQADAEGAGVGRRRGPADHRVDARGLRPADVDQRPVDGDDRARQGRILRIDRAADHPAGKLALVGDNVGRIDGGDDVVLLDRPVVDTDRQPRHRLPDSADAPLGRGFRLQVGIAAGGQRHDDQAVVQRAGHRAARRVGKAGGDVGTARRLVQRVQRRGAEALAPGAAQQQFGARLPAQRHLGIGRRAEVAVVVPARRQLRIELRRDRNVRLDEQRQHVAAAADGLQPAADRRVAGQHRRIPVVRQPLPARLAAERQRQRAGRQRGDLLRRRGAELRGRAVGHLRRAVVDAGGQQCLSLGAARPPRVDEAAAQRRDDPALVDVAAAVLDFLLVGAVHQRRVDVPAGRLAFQADDVALRVGRRRVDARTEFGRAPAEEQAAGEAIGGGELGRVVRAVGRVDRAAEGRRDSRLRIRRDFGVEGVARPQRLGEGVERRIQPPGAAQQRARALDLGQDVGDGCGVEAAAWPRQRCSVGARQARRRRAAAGGRRVQETAPGTVDDVRRKRECRQAVDAEIWPIAGARALPLGAVQHLLLLVRQHAEDVVAVAVRITRAQRHACLPRIAAAVLRGVERGGGVEAAIVPAQDEVDHAADGVGAVDGRGAVAQHFDAVDRRQRDRVQVDRLAVEGVVGEPPAIEQHQRRSRTQPAQVGGGQARLVAAADGLRGVDGIDVRRHALEQLLDGGHAAPFDLLAGDDLHRQRAFELGLRDVRAGDDHTLEDLRRRPRGRLRRHGFRKESGNGGGHSPDRRPSQRTATPRQSQLSPLFAAAGRRLRCPARHRQGRGFS